MTLYYPDCSNYQWSNDQDVFDFVSQLLPQGFAGLCHKVSEGANYADPYWPVAQKACQQYGVPLIGYHYVTLDNSLAQAQNYVDCGGTPNVMTDFEANSGDIGNFWAVVGAFNDAGVNVQLAYLPHWYHQQIGSPDLSAFNANGIQLVSSAYPDGTGYASSIYDNSGGDSGDGWNAYGGVTPAAWQFTNSALVAGLSVDCNAYLGSDINHLFGAPVGTVPTTPARPSLPTDDSVFAAAAAIGAQFIGAL